jgi:hypothetical protein
LEDEKQIHAASNNIKEEQDEMEDWGSTVFGAAHCLIWASPGEFLLVETCFNYFFGTRNRESEQTVTMTHALSCFVEVSIAFVGYDGELSYQRRPEVLEPPYRSEPFFGEWESMVPQHRGRLLAVPALSHQYC